MDAFDDTDLALMKFGVGQPVPRKEDPTLLRGEGRYTDDVNLPGQVYAVMVRSKIAHGILKGIDTKAASAMPGVLAILTHADLEAAGFGPLKCADEHPAARRLADEDAAAPIARQGQGALCRRSGGLRRGRDGGAGQGCRRSRRARHRGAAGRHHAGRCAEAGRAADPRRGAGQPGARLPLRRRRSGEEGLRRSGARHAAGDRFQPHRRQPDGAALGDRLLRSPRPSV